MSKKKSAIIDNDPLSWLSAEGNVDDDSGIEPEISEEVCDERKPVKEEFKAKAVSDAVPVENTAASDMDIKNTVEMKEIHDEAVNNENLAESDACNLEENQNLSSSEDAPVTEKINEEDVAMAASNEEIIVLEEDVSIVQVAGLKEAWLPYLDSGKDIKIDASAVEDVDTAGLQLLLSFVKTASESGRSVSWQSPSEALIQAVQETSLKDPLGIKL